MIKKKDYFIIILTILLLSSIFLNIKMIKEWNNDREVIKLQQEQILYQEDKLKEIDMSEYHNFLIKQEIQEMENKVKNE